MCGSRQPRQDVNAVIIGEGGRADEGGKGFVGDGPNEGCGVLGVEAIRVPESIEREFVGTLTTENSTGGGDAVLSNGEKRRRRSTGTLGWQVPWNGRR